MRQYLGILLVLIELLEIVEVEVSEQKLVAVAC